MTSEPREISWSDLQQASPFMQATFKALERLGIVKIVGKPPAEQEHDQH